MILIIIAQYLWLIYTKNISPLSDLRNIYAKHPSLIYASILFVVTQCISVFFAIDMFAALGFLKAFVIEPMILSFIFVSTYNRTHQTSIISGFLLSGALLTSLAIFQHYTGWMVPWDFWENRDTFRVTGWYGFPNGVGFILAFVATLSAGLSATYVKNNLYLRSLMLGVLSLLAVAGIVFAKSTGALMAVVGALAVALFLHKKTRYPTLLIGVIALWFIVQVPQLSRIKQELFLQDRSGLIRQDMWAEATVLIAEHPLTGVGLTNYQDMIYPYRIDKWIEVFHHPHNQILTFWISSGLFTAIAFLWLVVWYSRVTLTTPTKTTHLLLLLMTNFFIMGLVDSPYIKNDISIIFWLLIAITIIHTTPSIWHAGEPPT